MYPLLDLHGTFMITKLSIKNGTVGWVVVAHTFNPHTGEADADGWISESEGRPGLQSEFQVKNSQKEWPPDFLFSVVFSHATVLKLPVLLLILIAF